MPREAKKKTHEIREEEGVLVVSSSVLGQETEEVRTVRVRPFIKDAPVGSVTVKLGRTINTGNFESARIDVAFQVPGYVQELVPLYHDTLKIAESLLSEEVEKIEKSLGTDTSIMTEAAGERSIEDLLR